MHLRICQRHGTTNDLLIFVLFSFHAKWFTILKLGTVKCLHVVYYCNTHHNWELLKLFLQEDKNLCHMKHLVNGVLCQNVYFVPNNFTTFTWKHLFIFICEISKKVIWLMKVLRPSSSENHQSSIWYTTIFWFPYIYVGLCDGVSSTFYVSKETIIQYFYVAVI